jgi:hypothetical protein
MGVFGPWVHTPPMIPLIGNQMNKMNEFLKFGE